MLFIHHSNAQEILLRHLLKAWRTPLGDPLQPELVVVQNAGMARWLQQRIAAEQGICANVEFIFPGDLVWRLYRALNPDLPERSPFEREVLALRLLELMPQCLSEPRFAPLARYLDGDMKPVRQYQLAAKLADVFDQYLVYRPDWLLAWERGELLSLGEGEEWQAALWRRLADHPVPHRARLLERLLEADPAAVAAAARLPARLSVFGIASLPPAYLDVLRFLAQHLELRLCWLNPCREYWGEIVSARDLARWQARTPSRRVHAEQGNPLLACFGRLGRDAFNLQRERLVEPLVEREGVEEQHLFLEYAPSSLLDTLQQDVLALHDRRDATPVQASDRSLRIHVCHSPMRELEVLRDQLLAMFEDNPELMPRDVLVMTPDIEAYAPLIEAVFGNPEDERTRIPYTIADRSPSAESAVVRAFLQLLACDSARCSAAELMDLLQLAPVRARFRITETELPRIEAWLHETGVRWGLDAEHRAGFDLPAGSENTWASGLDRLLLGYALPLRQQDLYQDILPYDQVEGSEALVAGRLVSFYRRLRRLVSELQRDRGVEEWLLLLNEAIEDFMLPDEDDQPGLMVLREALSELAERAELARLTDPLPLAVLRLELEGLLSQPAGSTSYLAGQVTFAGMVPMRAVPFEVVAVLGLNDGAFPRLRRPPGFDLIAQRPRRGDRVLRDDDRYLFLEALLSARSGLYLSYVGRDVRDNRDSPPSPVVSELLDYLEQGFVAEGGGSLREQLVTGHPLQPFSPSYYRPGGPLFSYSAHGARIAACLGGPGEARPLFAEPLPEPEAEWYELDLERLINFFQHPVRFLLRERLRLKPEGVEQELADRECFAFEKGPRRRLLRELIECRLRDGRLPGFELVRARGELPHGVAGEIAFQQLVAEAGRMADRVQAQLGDPRPPQELVFSAGGCRLSGWLRGLSSRGLVSYREGQMYGSDCVEFWLRHLALQVLAPAGVAAESVWVESQAVKRLPPLPAEQARAHLEALLALYRQGLRQPLPFFPASAKAYCEQRLRKGMTPEEALEQARKVWLPNQGYTESDDVYYRLAFRDQDPLDGTFAELAEQVLGPFYEVVSDGR